MSVRYNWAGDTIIRDTIMWNKRAVLGFPNVFIPCDIREWITSDQSEVIRQTLREIDLPTARAAGTFDLRAWKVWKYVAESVEYIPDKQTVGMEDFWFFPTETLTLRKGDCEDSSFLLASLMIASGVSEQCVRVVIGKVVGSGGSFGHCWVVYQNEDGQWCLLESTLDSVPEALSLADPLTGEDASQRYEPQFCFNGSHLWTISPSNMTLAEYVRMRGDQASWRPDPSQW